MGSKSKAVCISARLKARRCSLRGLGSTCARAAAMGEAAASPATRANAVRREGFVSQARSISAMVASHRGEGCMNTQQAGVDRRERWTAAHAHISRQFGLQHFDNALHA